MSESADPAWHRRRGARAALAVAALVAIAALGPRERFAERWSVPTLGDDWPEVLAADEAAVPDLRPGDGAEVVWADPEERAPTPLSLVYLHGFSADRHEVEPLVSDVAAILGANVYFARLRGHGRGGAAMAEVTVQDWLDDTVAAFERGRRIGARVVLVGTSTGGTLAAWAASRAEVADDLAALVLLSPNFHPKDRTSRVLLWPWGGLIARAVTGPERCFEPENEAQASHWTVCYPVGALLPMMALVEHVRTMDLSTVSAPTLAVYAPSDEVVDAAETARVLAGMTGTTVRAVPYEGSADPAQHILTGEIMSPGSTAEITTLVAGFLEGVLKSAALAGAGRGDRER